MTKIQLKIQDYATEMNPLTGLPEKSILDDYFDIEWVDKDPDHVFTILRTIDGLLYGLDNQFINLFDSGDVVEGLVSHFMEQNIDEKIGYIYWSDYDWEEGYIPLRWDARFEQEARPLKSCTYSEFKSKKENW